MNVIKRITELKERRGWSDYAMAEKSGLSTATISAWYNKGYEPSVHSLELVCEAFGITLSQFFMEEGEAILLNQEEKNLLEHWNALGKEQKRSLLELIKNMPSK